MSAASISFPGQDQASLPTEVELKFSLTEALAKRIWHIPPLADLLNDRPESTRLYSAYYDTPSLDLQRRGVALRLRRQKRRWLQTLKTAGNPGSVLQQRVELEVPLARGVPDLEWIGKSGLPELADDVVSFAALDVIFTTQFKRSATIVEPVPGTRIEVCVDEGVVPAGSQSEPIRELELELREGRLAPLFDLAAQLAAHSGIRVETVSKAQRGYRLASRKRAAPAKAEKVKLSPDDDIDKLFGRLAFACIAQLHENESGLLHSRDIEYLHQARIALRRLRSVFSVFSSAVPRDHFREQLAWLTETGRILGQARNWDVFVTEFLPRAGAGQPADAGSRALVRAAGRLRADARRSARDAISNTAYTIGMLRMTQKLLEQGWISERTDEQRRVASLRARKLARKVLGRAHRKLINEGEQLHRDNHHDVHQLRIRIKKLRYATELLAPLFRCKATRRKSRREYLLQLGAMQQVLGKLNDMANAGRLLEQLAGKRDSDRRTTLAYLRGYADAMSYASLADFDTAWQRFVKTKPFW